MLVLWGDLAETFTIASVDNDDLPVFAHLGLTRGEEILQQAGGALECSGVVLGDMELVPQPLDRDGVLLGLLQALLFRDLLAQDLILGPPALGADLQQHGPAALAR